MYILKILRHGPKNDKAQKGDNLTYALLDPSRLDEIKDFARKQAELFKDSLIEIETTPVDRAVETGKIVYGVLKEVGANVKEPKIDPLIGQFDMDSDGNPINLSSNIMSKLWNEGKKTHRYGESDAEHQSLYNWCSVGYDSLQLEGDDDKGITLRQMVSRIGSYVLRKTNEKENKITLAFGHSSTIETFLYLCLEMLEGKDCSDTKSVLQKFEGTGGALHPLTGITFKFDGKILYLEYFIGKPESELKRKKIKFDINILKQMVN